MDLLEVLGAFSFGLAVVFLIRLGMSSAQAPQVKIFTGITAAAIGGGALLLLGSIRNVAAAWPDEFWAYPVGLAVGLSVSKVLWKKADQGPDEFNFKLAIVALMVGAVILLAFPEVLPFAFPGTVVPKVLTEIIRSLGEALLIATVLAATVDLYVKRRTYREISADVFKFLIGYGLPDEFKDRIRELVTHSDLVRRDCSVIWNLSPIAGDRETFKLDCKVIYKLQNISPRRVDYRFRARKGSGEDQETRLIRLWGKFPNSAYDYKGSRLADAPVEADPAGGGWILGDKVWVDAQNIQHGLDFRVGADFESTLRRQFDYHVFAKPTLGATVIVEHPENFTLSLQPRIEAEPDIDPAGPGRVRSTWKYGRLFFSEDAIFLDWTVGTPASSAGNDASNLLKDKGQLDKKDVASAPPQR
jgi:hypothetical protein